LAPLVVVAAERDAFADRVFVREVTPLKRLVDNHHARRLRFILLRKIAASDQRDFHRAEIARADHSVLDGRSLSLLLTRTAFDGEWADAAHSAERESVCRGHGLDTGKAAEAIG